jgi:hypothetical protein
MGGIGDLKKMYSVTPLTLHMERLGWVARERGNAATARARLDETIVLANELGYSDHALGIKITLASAITRLY